LRGHDIAEPATSVRWTAAVCFLSAASFGLLLLRAWFRARYFDGVPGDGPFQLLNWLSRMNSGQTPGHDFPLFHGLGIVFAHYAVYSLLGRNLFASEFARQLLSPLGWTCAMTLLAYAVTGSRWVAMYALALFAAISCASNVDFSALPHHVASLIVSLIFSQPGLSMMALRWAYPAACGAALIWAFHSNNASPVRGAIAGILFGLAPSWAFEQGSFAVSAALASVTAWCLVRPSRCAIPALSAFVALLLPTTWFAFYALSGGHSLETLQFAFHTIPKNQGWYFGAPPNTSLAVMTPTIGQGGLPLETVRELTAAVVVAYLLAVTVLFTVLVVANILRARINADSRLLLGLGFLACFALLSGSSLTGYVNASYLIPSVNSVIIVSIGAAYFSIRERPRALVASATTVIVISFAAIVLAYTNELTSIQRATRAIDVAQVEQKISGVYPLGVYRSLFPLIDRVRSVPNATVFSTVRGMLDIATNQSPHGRVDYIIHAFDDEERRNFLKTFEQGNFHFVHTIKPTYMAGFEEWLQTSHWDFYRSLVERYAVVEQSDFSLLWQQRPIFLPLQLTECRSQMPDRQGYWQISPAKSPVFLQLTVDYEIHNTLGSIPIIGGLPRYLIEHRGLANRLPVSLNPYRTSTTWLARSVANIPAWIAPRLYSPLPGAKLTLIKVTVCEVAVPADVNPAFAHLFSGSDQQ
jgi:hypothetical protein